MGSTLFSEVQISEIHCVSDILPEFLVPFRLVLWFCSQRNRGFGFTAVVTLYLLYLQLGANQDCGFVLFGLEGAHLCFLNTLPYSKDASSM